MAGLRPPEPDIGVARHRLGAYLALLVPFALALLAFALLERLGLQTAAVPQAVIAAAVGMFAIAALFSPGRRPAEYYVARREVPPVIGGAAAAAGLAGLLAIRLVAGMDATSAEFLMAGTAVAVGAALFAGIIAPGLRRSGGYTSGDFLAARFGAAARLVGALAGFSASLLLFIGYLKTCGPLLSTLTGISPTQGLYAAAGLAALAALPGGLRSLSATQLVQYATIVLAALVPAAMLATQGGGAAEAPAAPPLPDLLGALGLPGRDAALGFALLAAGVVSLPALATQALAAPSPRAAGATVGRAVLFLIAFLALSLVLAQVLVTAAGLDEAGALAGDLVQQALLVAALPSVIEGLLMAGLLAALVAIGQTALFTAAAALSHDLWDETIDRGGPAGRRLLVARFAAVAVAAGGVWTVGAAPGMEAPSLLAWALAIAAAGILMPLVLGIWWRRCSGAGAAAGMAAGYGAVLLAMLLGSERAPAWAAMLLERPIAPADAAAVGVSLAFTVAVTVSLLIRGPAPTGAAQSRAATAPPRERPA